ncbi:regulator component [Streptomyces sp. NPDC004838]
MPEIEDDQLLESCEEKVDRLRLPYRFSTRKLCETMAELRGKPIIMSPVGMLGVIDAPCGIRLETPEADLIFYEQGTSVHHQRHILTHELCHVYCDHPGSLEIDASTAHALGVNPTLLMRMSGRTSYSTEYEREAEIMATVIRRRIYRQRESPSPQPEHGSDSWDALFAQPVKKGRFLSR